ncbi:short chain dehydrogenase [Bordetella genomosp. 1]|uniref:Short chain dehydrogenase n=1 Tax=Bordetella genomosp. 1 TaxID=1395607 RepID=A0A261SG63_9BORD|nr:SDR family oxidoreductase [Bordetella genomosp. 1]OZI36135.1 short chain dehydrogenase [Bordetella genomosp. 1]
MKILLTGATGFIGRHLLGALTDAGHAVVCPVRRVPDGAAGERASFIPAQFSRMTRAQDWRALLRGVDCVINAAGVFDASAKEFAAVHVRAPLALFDAARQCGARVIQISALGADARASTAFLRTKRRADDALRAAGAPAFIVQPSLVYGPGGTSAAWFERLALLPCLALPGGGRQRVQPVHVDDVVAGILALLDAPARGVATLAFCGPAPLSLRAYLGALRTALGGVGRPRVVGVPMALCLAAAPLASRLTGGLLSRASLLMLARGSVADPAPFAALLGRPPRAPQRFVDPAERTARHAQAVLGVALPVLRWCIALVWLWTAAVSFGLYPPAQSVAMLRDVGVGAALAPYALYGAAALDLVFGILTLAWRGRGRRWLWLAQALLIVGYTVIISLRLPEQWLHPFGPISKNLPMLAGLWLLWLHDAQRRGR